MMYFAPIPLKCKGRTAFIILSWLLLLGNPDQAQSQPRGLQEYTCITRYLPPERWENQGMYQFDPHGILMMNGHYHPLSIIQYGMICFYEYLSKGDTVYRNKFLAQISYFKDSTKIHLLHEGHSIGLPYLFNYKDLKSPWYSGMTQGNALSLLLRYYEWSKDSSILPVIQKINHLMLLPAEEGGCISKTKEGLTWIEEYPNSVVSPQVLNGFLNAWIGLHEYCLYFPGDTLAERYRRETLLSLKTSLDKFEGEFGPYYNRIKAPITKNYLKYQILEMEQMYQLTKDDLFFKQMMLWSYLVSTMPDKEKDTINLLTGYDFAVPLKNTDAKDPERLTFTVPDHFNLQDTSAYHLPLFPFILSEIFFPGKTLKIYSESTHTGDPVIFYRSEMEEQKLLNAPWRVNANLWLKNKVPLLIRTEDLYYQVLILYPVQSSESSINSVKIMETGQ